MNDNILGIELATWALIVMAVLAFWEAIFRPAIKRGCALLMIVFRRVRRTLHRKVLTPLGTFVLRKKHGSRISALVVGTYDEYRNLSESDRRLFMRLRGTDLTRLAFQATETLRTPEWVEEAKGKADRAFLQTSIFTQSQMQLECWNCAFFVIGLDDKKGWERSSYAGFCHLEVQTQETYPEGYCSHHSAMQGYELSKASVYNIAPVK